MINEYEEFICYTVLGDYTAGSKKDLAWMRRFTFGMLENTEGFGRVLTILARGYLFEGETPDIARTRRALCAWCSIPEGKKASPRELWQYRCCFPELHEEFPGLVDAEGRGWIYRHVQNSISFVKENPKLVSAHAVKHCRALEDVFDNRWRNKVRQYQVPIFSPSTEAAWLLSFDSVLADALELGPLRCQEFSFSAEDKERLADTAPEKLRAALEVLIAYYYANKPEDSDWVVLPATNFDAYFGTTSFSRRWLPELAKSAIARDEQSYGISRFKPVGEWHPTFENIPLPKC